MTILRNVPGIPNQRRRGSYISNSSSRGHLKILIAFLFGILLGRFWQLNSLTANQRSDTTRSSATSRTIVGDLTSSIKHLNDMPVRKTSHVDTNTGTAITKQQFLEPFLVPNVAGISVVTIHRNQTVEMHSHRSMHEFFYVLEGSATFFMNDNDNDNDNNNGQRRRQGHPVIPGTFVHFVPNCVHGIVVADDTNSSGGDLKVLLVGVTVGD